MSRAPSWKPDGEPGRRQGGGDLLHLAHEAPRLPRIVAEGALGARGDVGLEIFHSASSAASTPSAMAKARMAASSAWLPLVQPA